MIQNERQNFKEVLSFSGKNIIESYFIPGPRVGCRGIWTPPTTLSNASSLN